MTELQCLIYDGNLTMLQEIYEIHPEIMSESYNGEYPLMAAWNDGSYDYDIMQWMMEIGVNMNYLHDNIHAREFLHIILDEDEEHLPLLELILFSLNINSVEYGKSPLIRAVESNKYHTVNLLLKHGANINFRIGIRNAFDIALENCNFRIVNLLYTNNIDLPSHDFYGNNITHRMAIDDNHIAMEYLLDMCIFDFTETNNEGHTPLDLSSISMRNLIKNNETYIDEFESSYEDDSELVEIQIVKNSKKIVIQI